MPDPTTSPESSGSEDRALYRWVLLVFGVMFAARLLGVYNIYFLEEDEISLAAGIAALVRDNVGDLYRYTPQIGYYRMVEWVDLILGGDVSQIPWLMKLWSVTVGALIPALSLLLFRDRLALRERWLVALTLAVNPILWRSSQYGNTAMGSLGFVMLGLVFLSNRGGARSRALGLGFFGLAVFVRADAILLLPLVAYLLYVQLGAIRPALIWLAGLGAVALAAVGAILLLDPRLDGALGAVARHMLGDWRTQFWEYLIWSISPLALGFGILGFRALSEGRSVLLTAVALGCLGPMAFYFRATTTPRYFLLATIPLAIAIAVGMDDVAGRLTRRFRPAVAWAMVLLASTAHMLVGMGQFRTDLPRSYITDAWIMTHDGQMPTGALLYDTYLRGGLFWQSFRNSGFGHHPGHWEGITWPHAVERLEDRGPGKVFLLFDAGWDHVFHFYAQAAGATYVSRATTSPSAPFASETWLEIGGTSVMTLRYGGADYEALDRFDAEAGDEIWITGRKPFPDESVYDRLPDGLRLRVLESFDDRIRVFRAEAASGG